MDLDSIRYSLTLARELSFTRAAAAHFISSQAFGRRIAALEADLGYQVFARTSRRVELTPRGRRFVREAAEIIERVDALPYFEWPPSRHHLIVGVLGFGLGDRWRPLLDAFRRDFPDVRLEFRELDFARQSERVESGELDIAIVGHGAPGVEPLLEMPGVAVVPPESPLAGKTTLEVAELHNMLRIDVPGAPPTAGWRRGSHRTVTVGTPASIPIAVATTGAVSLHGAAAARYYPNPDVRYLPVVDFRLRIGIASRPAPHGSIVAAFRETAREYAAQ